MIKKKDASKAPSMIKFEEVNKAFTIGKQSYKILHDVNFEIKHGEFTIVYGQSGSGKSTILHTLIGLEQSTSGKVTVSGHRFDRMNAEERAIVRGATFGVVYQQPIWVKSLTVQENVALPLLIDGAQLGVALKKASGSLTTVGMHKFAKNHPTELSGGQQQRVSLARALIHNPRVLVLDEPTGNLDTHSADEIMALLQDLQLKHDRTIVMVTHNLIYLPFADRTIEIQDGRVLKMKTGHIMHP